MTREEFTEKFGMTPEKCREIMETVARIINWEAAEIIEHADYYMDPTSYVDEDDLKEEYGPDALEKDDDADGYPNLYDFRKGNSPEKLFMDLISLHTHYGGHTTAIEACKLMGKWERWHE